MLAVLALALLVIALLGCAVVGLEIAAVRAFAAARTTAAPELAGAPGVTLLKPLHGAEPGLFDSLCSFANQRYAGPMQLLFGVAEASDPALEAVQRLRQACPGRRIDVAITGPAGTGNAKVANLAGMSATIAHELIVLSDSDIRVGPDYLERTIAALQQPATGLVTCLYRGDSASGFWGSVAAMWIDERFFPSVLLGVRLGRARPCVGATMAFSRTTLERIGGFAAFAGHLADDYAIGEAVRATGQAVRLGCHVVEHRSDEASLGAVFAHELRWARTIRGLDPAGHATSFVLHPLPFALAGSAVAALAVPGLAPAAAAWLSGL
ncbi:MAG: bacteriohopanetetrol glucosamine biosynthesis glycosyltransferase HpnI, partial [Pseudomonadota bacterium]|nr:bacteriohopanetetrol glucosamine biosynthesis glycosyltransferase HpnI [Pseudomonadota bacterium]